VERNVFLSVDIFQMTALSEQKRFTQNPDARHRRSATAIFMTIRSTGLSEFGAFPAIAGATSNTRTSP
jgi:hypothetical protein